MIMGRNARPLGIPPLTELSVNRTVGVEYDSAFVGVTNYADVWDILRFATLFGCDVAECFLRVSGKYFCISLYNFATAFSVHGPTQVSSAINGDLNLAGDFLFGV